MATVDIDLNAMFKARMTVEEILTELVTKINTNIQTCVTDYAINQIANDKIVVTYKLNGVTQTINITPASTNKAGILSKAQFDLLADSIKTIDGDWNEDEDGYDITAINNSSEDTVVTIPFANGDDSTGHGGLMTKEDKQNLDASIRSFNFTYDEDGVYVTTNDGGGDDNTITLATHEHCGIMSAEDKVKVDSLPNISIDFYTIDNTSTKVTKTFNETEKTYYSKELNLSGKYYINVTVVGGTLNSSCEFVLASNIREDYYSILKSERGDTAIDNTFKYEKAINNPNLLLCTNLTSGESGFNKNVIVKVELIKLNN